MRILLKAPLITLVAVLSLAIGIGANTAIFCVINSLVLRYIPVRDPKHLVTIGALDPAHPEHPDAMSLALFDEIRRRADVFSSVAAWSGGPMSNFEAAGVKYAGRLDQVSGDYFATLGVYPIIGRVLTRDDAPLDGGAADRVAVISYDCWRHRFNGDSNILGKVIGIEGNAFTIVGVSPEHFAGLLIDSQLEATVPFGSTRRLINYREDLRYQVLGHLKNGRTIDHARAQLQVLWPVILKASVPDAYHGSQRSSFLALRANIQSAAHGNSYLRHELAKPLWILILVTAAVLLIACVNLANLFLASAAARQHEFGTRIALGATRWSLIRMLLVQALLLSCSGAILAMIIAPASAQFVLDRFWTGYIPLSVDVSPDFRVTVLAGLLALLTSVLFGVAPAMRMSRNDPITMLSQRARTTTGNSGRFGRALLVFQITLSLILVWGTSLLIRSFRNLQAVNLGYRHDHVLVMRLFPQAGHERISNRTHYYRELLSRVTQLPGVISASYQHMGPASGYEFQMPVTTRNGALVSAAEEWVGPDFFRTLGMHVLAGREFSWRDDEYAPRVAVISESLAQMLFKTENPIGHTVNVGARPEYMDLTIIGIVNSASLWRFDSHEPLAIYHPLMQEPRFDQNQLIVVTKNNPKSIAQVAERAVESVGYHYSLRTETLEELTDEALVLQKTIALLASAFSVLALVLAGIGLYGVTSYAVTRRTPEIGVRMALGASRVRVVGMILGEILILTTIGITIAIPAALGCRKLLSTMLFGVSMMDPLTIIFSSSVLITVVGIAGWIPASRVLRMEPMVALRCE